MQTCFSCCKLTCTLSQVTWMLWTDSTQKQPEHVVKLVMLARPGDSFKASKPHTTDDNAIPSSAGVTAHCTIKPSQRSHPSSFRATPFHHCKLPLSRRGRSNLKHLCKYASGQQIAAANGRLQHCNCHILKTRLQTQEAANAMLALNCTR